MNAARDGWETRVQSIAQSFSYPPTPDLTHVVARPAVRSWPVLPRWAWAVAITLVFLIGLLAVPGVRAAVIEVLRLGAVRIFMDEPIERETPQPPASGGAAATPPPPAATPQPSPTPLNSVLDLAGETTLALAHTQVTFPILLPTYPPDLGAPDGVFVQELEGRAVVLVWLQPGKPGQVRMSLTQIGGGLFFDKRGVRQIEETYVNGEWALWLDGPHTLQTHDGDQKPQRMVEGHVLLWEADGVTYRLETDLPLAEARKVAESLRVDSDQ